MARTLPLLLAGFVAALVLTPTAGAAPCERNLLRDWSDNGRIDRTYPLRCYQAALDALPADLRDYTNAGEVISRALTEAVREADAARGAGEGLQAIPAVAAREPSAPAALLVAIGVALAVLTAGGLGFLVRRLGGKGPQHG